MAFEIMKLTYLLTHLAYEPHACLLQRSRMPLELIVTTSFLDVDADVGAVAVPESTDVAHRTVLVGSVVVVSVVRCELVIVVVQK